MKKRIWIMNHYAGNMYFDHGGRHYNFAKYLKQAGYEPVVFCANSKHNTTALWFETDALWHEHMAEEIETPFVFVKARTYVGNGKQRVLNMVDFYRGLKKAGKEYAAKHGRPDIIYASSVHPLTLVAGLQLAKHFGVRCICEMRDLWPEGIVAAYPDRLSRQDLPVRLLYQGEKWIYKKADALIFTQEGGPAYIQEQGWDTGHGGPIDLGKAYHINNGVDLEVFEENLRTHYLEDPDLDDPNIFKVVYTGAIRKVNNLGLILDAAKEISDPRVKFLIWGDGNELDELRQRVADEGVKNVVFKGQVNKQYIPSIVSRADLNIVHWQMTEILRVGESYNKLFEYLAAGKPVFYTVRPAYSIAEKYQCGAITDGFTPKDIADGIMRLARLTEEEKAALAVNAKKAAKEYDFPVLTKKLINIIES